MKNRRGRAFNCGQRIPHRRIRAAYAISFDDGVIIQSLKKRAARRGEHRADADNATFS
jgi:hypothetical protein